MTTPNVRFNARLGLVVLLALALAPSAVAQVTTGTIRGRVVDDAGQPAAAVQLTATNQETGVSVRTETATDGRYQFSGLLVGPYAVQVRRVGFAPLERRGIVLHIGETVTLDFRLEPAVTELEAITVVAEEQPLIDRTQSGYVDLINEDQVQAIPTNGRNFADLVALSPAVQLSVGDGSGGNLSLGGGRRGANLIQIDGAGSTGTFFGGEARGSDRIPFAYSIEAVREFQVVTNAYDVEYGFFAGGVINAVTKSGTNEFHGSVFGYLRNESLTGDDFFGNEATEFDSRQLGANFSGPIIRDKMHFYMSVERQDRDEPIFGLPAPGSDPDLSTGIHPDSVQRFLDILQNTYGVSDQAGRFAQTQDETSIFARLDWQISDRHRLILRHNYTDLNQQFDRISTNEFRGNGGVFLNTGNSTVLSLHSLLSPTVRNELRLQYATEPRPREASSLIPETTVDITSDFGGGTTARLTAEAFNDPVLPNNLEETTFEAADNLYVQRGPHQIKLGVHANVFSYENFFFFRQQGRFRFRSLANLESGVVRDFTRSLPNPGPDGLFFTGDDLIPLAVYDVNEVAVYAQDTWEVTDRLSLTGGVRVDFTSFPDKAPLNQALVDTSTTNPLFGGRVLRTTVTPGDNNFSPRLGFTYALDPDARRLVRGGIGLFYGRFPAVLYSNSLLNWGGNQVSLFCSGAAAPPPVPDLASYAADPSTIPTQCAGGGGTSAPVATVNLFAPDFQYPRSLKLSAGYEHAVGGRAKVGIDLLYSKTTDNFYVVDRNLLDEQFRTGVENRPVSAPISGIRTDGSLIFGRNRKSAGFGPVLDHVSPAESRTYQAVLSAEQRFTDWFSWQLAYTYTDTEDNSSYSCCISSTALFETPTSGNVNFLGEPGDDMTGTWGPADFDRRHTFVASASVRLPFGLEVSGIWRTTSGRPWTPVVDGDVNADGTDENDRAYIGTNLLFADPVADPALMQQFINEWDCLAEQEGRIASRNSCRNPRNTTVDLRLRYGIRTAGSQRAEVVTDFFNVLNLFNDNWGAPLGVAGSDNQLLVVRGFDAATARYRYAVNPSFGKLSDLTPFRTDQFQVQVGVRYSF